MSNPAADFPTNIHTDTDISALATQKLGTSNPKHSEVEGKQEEEIKATQTKLGSGVSSPTNGKVLIGDTTAGTSVWSDLATLSDKEYPSSAWPLGYAWGKDPVTGVFGPISLAAGAGETNTGANIGNAGVGPYASKSGVQLQFKNISSPGGTLNVTDNTTDHNIELDVNQSNLSLGSITGTLGINKGGTGQTTKSAAFDALSPMDTLGDIITGGTGGTGVKLAGNTTSTRKFLRQVGASGAATPPSWDTLQAGDIPILTSAKISDFAASVTATKLNAFAAPDGNVDMSNKKIVNVANPTNPQDASTKYYVDSVASGLQIKASCRAATTDNIADLSSVSTSMDGIVLVQGDRVLVKDQTTGSQNGIYVVGLVNNGTAPFTRSSDADTDSEVQSGMFTFIQEGTTNHDNGYVLTTDNPITLDTTSLTFTQFSGAGQIVAGAGLTKTGNTLDVGAGNGITVGNDTISIDTSVTVDKTTVQTLTGKTMDGASNTFTNLPATGLTGVVPNANGGTGFSTYTKGDLLVGTATGLVKLPVGTNGKVLAADSTQTSGLNYVTPSRAIYDAVIDAGGNGDYTTWGAAIAAGKYRCKILPGTYNESTNLNSIGFGLSGKQIVLEGVDPENTIINIYNGSYGYIGLYAPAYISGVTFKQPAYTGSFNSQNICVLIRSNNITFDHCVFTGSASASYPNSPLGTDTTHVENISIRHCKFIDTDSQMDIHLYDVRNVEILSNTFYQTTSTRGMSHIYIERYPANVTIEGNRIYWTNQNTSSYRAIYCNFSGGSPYGQVTISNNTIINHDSPIQVNNGQDAPITITGNVMSCPTSHSASWGMLTVSSCNATCNITGNVIFTGSMGNYSRYGIKVENSTYANIVGNSVIGDPSASSVLGTGIYITGSTSANVVGNSVIHFNASDSYGRSSGIKNDGTGYVVAVGNNCDGNLDNYVGTFASTSLNGGGAAAPTGSTWATPTNYIGVNSTNALCTPTDWLNVKVDGVARKIPLY